MKKIIAFLMSNPITYALLSLITYAFYGVVIGISLAPSVYFLYKLFLVLNFDLWQHILIFALAIGVALYLFFIVALIVFGILEKILTTGFKPGKYSTDSGIFARWLIYSGLHVILLNLVLPYMSGTPWAKIFYKILGAKFGKNVFINTRGLHDAYLLEIGENVVIGGETDISCHIFEGSHLILGNIKIGSNTLIGTHCYIMPGVTIGEKCNIGIYSYVRKNKKIEDGSMIMAVPGVPAKKVVEIIKD